MRTPRIRVSNQLQRQRGTQTTTCLLCMDKICQKEDHAPKIITRSVTKWKRGFEEIIIYETYRCMPLLGDEKIHAPDWEEHVVRYHIVFIKAAKTV